jgi:hypothetical protein
MEASKAFPGFTSHQGMGSMYTFFGGLTRTLHPQLEHGVANRRRIASRYEVDTRPRISFLLHPESRHLAIAIHLPPLQVSHVPFLDLDLLPLLDLDFPVFPIQIPLCFFTCCPNPDSMVIQRNGRKFDQSLLVS